MRVLHTYVVAGRRLLQNTVIVSQYFDLLKIENIYYLVQLYCLLLSILKKYKAVYKLQNHKRFP